MGNNRNIDRFRKRLSVRFGPDGPDRLGFSEDISAHGLFIKTASICALGTIIQIELTLPDNSAVFMEGMVRWSKKVPPQMIHKVNKSGMGIKIVKFIAGKVAFDHFMAELHTKRF